MVDYRFYFRAMLVACFVALSVMTATAHAGIFGSRQVVRQRIVQPRQQVVRQQIFVPRHQVVQQFVVPQAVVSPFAIRQQVIVPHQQIIVPQAILQPSQAIIYGNSGAFILR